MLRASGRNDASGTQASPAGAGTAVGVRDSESGFCGEVFVGRDQVRQRLPFGGLPIAPALQRKSGFARDDFAECGQGIGSRDNGLSLAS